MNRLSKEKANLIASHYCTNGYKKVQALLDSGYKTSYANSNIGLKLFDNSQVLQAIDRIQAATKATSGYTIEDCQREYDEARLLAIKLNQPAAAVSAITGKARLHGYDKDNDLRTNDTLKPLSEQEIELLKEQARELTKPNLKIG